MKTTEFVGMIEGMIKAAGDEYRVPDDETRIAFGLVEAAGFFRKISTCVDVGSLVSDRKTATRIRANMNMAIRNVEEAARLVWESGLAHDQIVIDESTADFLLELLEKEREVFFYGTNEEALGVDLVQIDEAIKEIGG